MITRILYFGFRIFCFLFRPVRTGVRVMMIRDDHVVLVRQTYVPGWFMPGGGVKRGETLDQAARREAREETGAELGEITFLGAYTNFSEWKTDHNILFLCRDFKFVGRPDREVAEVRGFSLTKLPDHLWPGHLRRLEEYRAGAVLPRTGEW